MAYLGKTPSQAVRQRYIFTASGAETSISGADDSGNTLTFTDGGYVDVYLNGVLLVAGTDYNTTTANTIGGLSALSASDVVEIVVYDVFSVFGGDVQGDLTISNGTLTAGTTALGDVTADSLTVDTNTLHVDATNNRLGVGTSSPSDALHVYSNDVSGGINVTGPNAPAIKISDTTDGAISRIVVNNGGRFILDADKDNTASGSSMEFKVDGSEAMRIDSSGNLLVGTTDIDPYNNTSGTGIALRSSGAIYNAIDGGTALILNRMTSDGAIAQFRKNGSSVGSIGARIGALCINYSSRAGLSGTGSYDAILPGDGSNNIVDNLIDLGISGYRFDDIYATNGTIQTSDRNEKQDIEELSEAEQRVAVAAKSLMRKFRWKDAVEEKGDDARIHFGIIAQDLQAAFEAEGLDAGRYAMFISSTWWEHKVEVPAVEAKDAVLDEEGNVIEEAVEAKEAYTRTDTYESAEEAPEGAVERTRLGVRYSELLAFIIAAI